MAVILYHYTVRYDELFGHVSRYAVIFPNGGKAVALFFILSGYFAISHIEGKQIAFYMTKRFFRMYPTYWIAVLITFPLVSAFLPSRSVSFTDALLNLSMMQGFFKISNVDGAYWTLQYELFFYILIGILILLRLNK